MTSFSDLGLAEPLLRALTAEGYTAPTPIQQQAIPAVLSGRDLLGIAQTGTGKTAAFALPILHRLATDRRPAGRQGCRALILSPTRELATQIGDSFRTYGRHLELSVAVVFGGVAHRPQIQATRNGVDILVATPGRLLDHIAERNINITGAEIFVLDEADQMLDLGFVKPIRKIVSYLTIKRQNLFFSATMPREIGHLADELLNDPAKVAVAPVASTVDRVSQRVIHVTTSMKRQILIELLADEAMSRTLVFTRTKRGADRVSRHLEDASISAAAIHGNKSQRQREDALDSFRASKIRVLVATDIAARGIDIDNVTHVINYELPDVPESYVHRIGRTARAGAEGSAISLCDGEERGQLRDIERLTRQTIPAEDRRGGGDGLAAVLGTDEKREPRRRWGGANGRPHRSNWDGAERRPAGDRSSSDRPRSDRTRRQDAAAHGENRPAHNGEARESRPAGEDRNRHHERGADHHRGPRRDRNGGSDAPRHGERSGEHRAHGPRRGDDRRPEHAMRPRHSDNGDRDRNRPAGPHAEPRHTESNGRDRTDERRDNRQHANGDGRARDHGPRRHREDSHGDRSARPARDDRHGPRGDRAHHERRPHESRRDGDGRNRSEHRASNGPAHGPRRDDRAPSSGHHRPGRRDEPRGNSGGNRFGKRPSERRSGERNERTGG